MPEGPEVRRLVDNLQEIIPCRLGNIEAISGRYTKTPIVGLEDCLSHHHISSMGGIHEINCKGKFIYWEIPVVGDIWYLFCTLGMTGTYKTEPNKYARIKFTFNNYDVGKYIGESYLYYCDMRNFGTMKFVLGEKELEKKLNSLGPDMLSDPCSLDEWFKICEKRKRRSLVSFLMEQSIICGVGNIYKSESLYLARLDPRRKIGDCSQDELERLYHSVKRILKISYEIPGGEIKKYSDLFNNAEEYSRFASQPSEMIQARTQERHSHADDKLLPTSNLMVYAQQYDPLGNRVETLKLSDGRTTHYVPEIQT